MPFLYSQVFHMTSDELLKRTYIEKHPLLDYELGRRYFWDQDYEKAFPLLDAAAKYRLRGAEFLAGVCYLNGLGVPKNPQTAVGHFQRAALQGEPDAMLSLGDCYVAGEGVQADAVAAVYWYSEAEKAGDPLAANLLLRLMRRVELDQGLDPVEQRYILRAMERARNAAAPSPVKPEAEHCDVKSNPKPALE